MFTEYDSFLSTDAPLYTIPLAPVACVIMCIRRASHPPCYIHPSHALLICYVCKWEISCEMEEVVKRDGVIPMYVILLIPLHFLHYTAPTPPLCIPMKTSNHSTLECEVPTNSAYVSLGNKFECYDYNKANLFYAFVCITEMMNADQHMRHFLMRFRPPSTIASASDSGSMLKCP